MQKALLLPVMIGASIIDKLAKNKKTQERTLFEDLLSRTFVVIQRLLEIQKTEYVRFTYQGGALKCHTDAQGVSVQSNQPQESYLFYPQFHQVVLLPYNASDHSSDIITLLAITIRSFLTWEMSMIRVRLFNLWPFWPRRAMLPLQTPNFRGKH